MKSGANFKDRNSITALAAEGKDAGTISDLLQIPLKCIESFMPKQKKKPGPKPKTDEE